MRIISKKKHLTLVFPILGLVVLLLISPCNIRNFIQSELGLEQTEVTNKSKATLKNHQCDHPQIEYKAFNKEEKQPEQLQSLNQSLKLFFKRLYLPTKFITYYSSVFSRVNSVPLYILYQNLKNYL